MDVYLFPVGVSNQHQSMAVQMVAKPQQVTPKQQLNNHLKNKSAGVGMVRSQAPGNMSTIPGGTRLTMQQPMYRSRLQMLVMP